MTGRSPGWRALAVLAALPAAGHAAEAVPVPVDTSLGFGLLQMLLALGVVLAAILGAAWLLRRYGPGSGAAGVVRVVGAVPLGPRERLVVVEVGDTWLLLGVSPGGVSRLHRMPRPEGVLPESEASFAERLLAAGKRHEAGK